MRFLSLISLLLGAAVLTTCRASQPPVLLLMETPAIYHGAAVDPFAHMDDSHRSTELSVFFATNREPRREPSGDQLPYGNGIDEFLHLGEATVHFGDGDFSWESLYQVSISPTRNEDVPLTLQAYSEMATLPVDTNLRTTQTLSAEQQGYVTAINAELARSKDKEIMIYVHGTKVDFLNAVALTSEIDHFSGRDFVGVAFAWPSHQNILYYLLGMDVRRAVDSSDDLHTLLEFLAKHTTAARINLLSYSAGGRVASKALYELRQAHSELDAATLRQMFRLDTVVFAAADVPIDTFLERLPSVTAVAGQVVVTVSDDDPALAAAKKFMGHGLRAGMQQAEAAEESLVKSLGITNFHVVDVSLNQERRGFDIVGHHYWYRNPWASSDIVLLMRTSLPPRRRGLKAAEFEGIYYLPPDYPDRVRKAVRRELGGTW